MKTSGTAIVDSGMHAQMAFITGYEAMEAELFPEGMDDEAITNVVIDVDWKESGF